MSTTHWRTFSLVSALLLLIGFAGCGSGLPGIGSSGTPTPAGCSGSDCTANGGIQAATLYVEPEAGESPIVNAIKGAKQSIELEMYLLTDRSTINALEDAAHRGVKVQVMLEAHPAGSGSTTPQETMSALNAAGAQAQPTNPAFQLTHAKMMVIDQKTAYISSANYTKSALGGSSGERDRDYIVMDPTAADVQECNAIFTADWARTQPTLSDPNLVVSPVNARAKILALINGAQSSLHLEEEEMSDPATISALVAAAKRSVQVEVVVPKPSSSSSSDASGEAQLTQGGVKVVAIDDAVKNADYIHAKMIIADGKLAYVGSVNVSTASYDDNREVGVLIANAQIIAQLNDTFSQDFGA